MTQVSIDNPPVSVVLSPSESLTPATGEILDIDIIGASNVNVEINSNDIKVNEPFSIILTDSDTLTNQSSSSGRLHVSGFDVS